MECIEYASDTNVLILDNICEIVKGLKNKKNHNISK